MIKSIFFLILLPWLGPAPQDTLSLNECYQLARENYPVVKKIKLQQQITDLKTNIAKTGNYPQIQINGKGTYQSEVTEFSSPGGEGPPPISRDQYEIALDVSQPIYNGGITDIQESMEQDQGKIEQLKDEVTLHQIRAQIDQVYFGILLAEEQRNINHLQSGILNEQLKTIRSRVKNGVLLPGQQHILEAELAHTAQDSIDISENIKTGRSVLSQLTGSVIDTETKLEVPDPVIQSTDTTGQRPEVTLFEASRQLLDRQKDLVQANKVVKINAFGRAAYGRPGNLNFLNDTFHDYYMVGIRLNWDLWNNLNAHKQLQSLELQKEKINNDRQAFDLQLNTRLDRLTSHIDALKNKISRDNEIIGLREQIVKESSSQMNNGVITATEYVTELNRSSQARLALYVHKIELSQTKIQFLTEWGQPLGQPTSNE